MMLRMFFFFQTMDPGQDLLLAALSESGICPNDLFDIDSQDTAQSPASQQVNKSINEGLVVFGMRIFDALGVGVGQVVRCACWFALNIAMLINKMAI